MGHKGCLSLARDLFNELGSWRDESQIQFSNIMNLHNSNIIKGIGDLVAEVSTLQSQLSITSNERNILMETVKNLSDEIRQLKSEFSITTNERNTLIETVENFSDEITQLKSELTILQPLSEPVRNHHKDQDAVDVEDTGAQVQEVEGLITGNETEDDEMRVDSNNQFDEMTRNEMPAVMVNENAQNDANQYDIDWEEDEHLETREKETALPDASKNFRCELCPFKTNNRKNLNTHINRMHNKKGIACKDCGKLFREKRGLDEHRATAHGFGGKRYKCEQCRYETARTNNLQVHIKVVHEKIKRFFCRECNYAAALKAYLAYHIESVHSRDKKFKCDKCPHAAASKGNLKNHTESAHNMGEKKFKCEICSYKSNFKRDLKTHVLKAHLYAGTTKTEIDQ